jgi:predicted RNase H-like HicB family nuclease
MKATKKKVRPQGQVSRREREDADDLRAALEVMNDPTEEYKPLEEVVKALGLKVRPLPKPAQRERPSKARTKRGSRPPKARLKFLVTIERGCDGWLVADCPAIPGCMSQGRNETEAMANLREAIRLCLEIRSARGIPLTIETRQIEIEL